MTCIYLVILSNVSISCKKAVVQQKKSLELNEIVNTVLTLEHCEGEGCCPYPSPPHTVENSHVSFDSPKT